MKKKIIVGVLALIFLVSIAYGALSVKEKDFLTNKIDKSPLDKDRGDITKIENKITETKKTTYKDSDIILFEYEYDGVSMKTLTTKGQVEALS